MKRLSVIVFILSLLSFVLAIVNLVFIFNNVLRGETYRHTECWVSQTSPSEELRFRADKGDLYWKLENPTDTATKYTVRYKAGQKGEYQTVFCDYVGPHNQTFWFFVDSYFTAADRYFLIQQDTNLPGEATSSIEFYIQVR